MIVLHVVLDGDPEGGGTLPRPRQVRGVRTEPGLTTIFRNSSPKLSRPGAGADTGTGLLIVPPRHNISYPLYFFLVNLDVFACVSSFVSWRTFETASHGPMAGGMMW